MTTVKGSKGNVYEVRSELYGTHNLTHRLYYGGIMVSSTQAKSSAVSSITLEAAIKEADSYVERLGIEIGKNK